MGFGCQTAQTNAQMSYNEETKELMLVFNINTLNADIKSKLLNNKLEKDYFLYTNPQDYRIPNYIKEALDMDYQIKNIKKGLYLVKIKEDQIVMKLKLD